MLSVQNTVHSTSDSQPKNEDPAKMTPQQFLALLGQILSMISLNTAQIQKADNTKIKDETKIDQSNAKVAAAIAKVMENIIHDAEEEINSLSRNSYFDTAELTSDFMDLITTLQNNSTDPNQKPTTLAESIDLREKIQKAIDTAILDFKKFLSSFGGGLSFEQKVVAFIIFILKELSVSFTKENPK